VIEILKELIPDTLIRKLRNSHDRLKSIGKPKIFGIGYNKTGTTSLKVAMSELGFVVGHQRKAENLIHDWANRDFRRIIKYCKTAQFFQDVPFSKPFTYIAMDQAFPGSKFILTKRDNPEQWYHSLIQFHARLWGKDGRVPTKEDLQQANYIYKGRPWEANRLTYKTPEKDPYHRETLIRKYEKHNQSVLEYFRFRQDDLLVLNVAEDNAYQELCVFLEVEPVRDKFPWKNRTKEKYY
jgi:hypothetical protein